MSNKWKDAKLDLDFIVEEEPIIQEIAKKYKIVISDDDKEVHTITKMILKNFEFEGYSLEFIDAYTGVETMETLKANPDTAILFQDVVMESNQTGLEVVKYLREELKNQLTRIVLRTGQPGEAPEEKIIKEYDINDYRLKTELTVNRLNTTLYSALRNYRDIVKIDKYRQGLEKIIETSASLFTNDSLNEFLTSVLEQLSGFYQENTEIMYIRDTNSHIEKNGFVTLNQSNKPTIVAATGKYSKYIGMDIAAIPEFHEIANWMVARDELRNPIEFIGSGFIIKNTSKKYQNNYIFIEGKKEEYDFDLIKLFLSNYSVALDNYILKNMILSTQKEIIVTLGEMVECHFDETGSHVKRVSTMMYKFASTLGLSFSECEKLRIASTLHDVGKIGIPDAIIKKPGKLTKEEFDIIKEHTILGHKILSKSELEILKIAAEIALDHHEREDGTGYPNQLVGGNIPLYPQMLAIIDVYDAMTHRRVYKDASPREEAINYIREQKGKQFNSILVDIFLDNVSDIIYDDNEE